jgi:hypothetical protein
MHLKDGMKKKIYLKKIIYLIFKYKMPHFKLLPKAPQCIEPALMTIYINMFRAFVEDRICCNVKSSRTVTKHQGRLRMRNSKITEQRKDPNKLTRSRHHTTVFSFSRRPRDSRLFLGFP